jgi:hypothetical protein
MDSTGLLASTNHFVGSSWNLAQVDDRVGGMTMRRRNNLLSLGEKFKGGFNPDVMMKILDTTLEEGGATVEGTIYQIIAVPQRLEFWLKVRGIQDWTLIPLRSLLRRE